KKAYLLAHKISTITDEEDDPRAIPGRGFAEINSVGTYAFQGTHAELDEFVDWLESLELPKYQSAALPLDEAEATLPAELLQRRTHDGGYATLSPTVLAPGQRVVLPKPDESVYNIFDQRYGISAPASPTPDTITGP